MTIFQLKTNRLLLIAIATSVFLGGCTFLLNTDGLIQECVSEIDCGDGFYCDDGACLPGEAPPPFIPEEPNLPSFNEDAGVTPDEDSDAGLSPPIFSNDGGSTTQTLTDAGVVSISIDAGNSEPITTVDAGSSQTETSEAALDSGAITPDVAHDAGNAPAVTTDSGVATAGPDNDAGEEVSDAISSPDAGTIADAG